MDEQPNAEQTRQQAVQEHVQESFADALKTFEGQTEDTGQTPPSEPADNGEAAAPVDKSVETPVQTEAPVEEPKLSTTEYYAKLAELDRQNRILRKQVKDREALPPQEDYAALAKEKPLEVMSKLGLDIDRILEAYAGADQSAPALDDASTVPPAIQAKLEKLEKLEKAVEELSTARTRETEAQQVRREVRQLDAMVTAAEQAAPGKYEYISATKDEGSLNLVLQTAAAIYEKDGEIPKYTEVLDMVENHLRETELKRLEKLQGLSFIKSRLTGAAPSVQTTTNGATKPQNGSKTLTPQEDTPTPQPLSKEDLFQLALKELGTE